MNPTEIRVCFLLVTIFVATGIEASANKCSRDCNRSQGVGCFKKLSGDCECTCVNGDACAYMKNHYNRTCPLGAILRCRPENALCLCMCDRDDA
uniref:Uncharacterized protein n=1 Tax=Rhipicephalus pulchellus TaxID=72859 RepID=L7LUJ5_RHIPC